MTEGLKLDVERRQDLAVIYTDGYINNQGGEGDRRGRLCPAGRRLQVAAAQPPGHEDRQLDRHLHPDRDHREDARGEGAPVVLQSHAQRSRRRSTSWVWRSTRRSTRTSRRQSLSSSRVRPDSPDSRAARGETPPQVAQVLTSPAASRSGSLSDLWRLAATADVADWESGAVQTRLVRHWCQAHGLDGAQIYRRDGGPVASWGVLGQRESSLEHNLVLYCAGNDEAAGSGDKHRNGWRQDAGGKRTRGHPGSGSAAARVGGRAEGPQVPRQLQRGHVAGGVRRGAGDRLDAEPGGTDRGDPAPRRVPAGRPSRAPSTCGTRRAGWPWRGRSAAAPGMSSMYRRSPVRTAPPSKKRRRRDSGCRALSRRADRGRRRHRQRRPAAGGRRQGEPNRNRTVRGLRPQGAVPVRESGRHRIDQREPPSPGPREGAAGAGGGTRGRDSAQHPAVRHAERRVLRDGGLEPAFPPGRRRLLRLASAQGFAPGNGGCRCHRQGHAGRPPGLHPRLGRSVCWSTTPVPAAKASEWRLRPSCSSA